MRKRFFNIMICMVVFISNINFSTVLAEEKTKMEDEQRRAVEVLNYIGILDEEIDGIDLEKSVTRGEFAVLAADLIKATPSEPTMHFIDLPESHYAYKSVYALVENGAVSKSPDRLFRPEQNITAQEAVKIMLSLAGYDVPAEASGGFPKGYMDIAYNTDICLPENFSSMNIAKAAELIFDVASMGMYRVSENRGMSSVYDVDSDNTLFSVYHDILIGEGRIMAAHGITSREEIKISEQNKVFINSEFYVAEENVRIQNYFMKYIEYVYIDTEDYAGSKIINVMPIDKENNEIEIAFDDFTDFDEKTYTISYMSWKKTKTENLSRGVLVIYNGYPYEKGIKSIAEEITEGENNGSITLCDTDKDDVYDVLVVKSYKNFVPAQISTGKVLNRYDNEAAFDIENYDSVVICDTMGRYRALESDVLYMDVAFSENGQFAEIIAYSEFNTGKLEGFSEQEETIVFDGTEYKIKPNVLKRYKNFEPGKSYSFVVNKFGYVGHIYENSATDENYAYIIKAIPTEEESFNIKLFTQKGEHIALSCMDKVRIDGKLYTDFDDITKALAGSRNPDIIGQMIRYGINSDNKIVWIDTENPGVGGSYDLLIKTHENIEGWFVIKGLSLNSTLHIGKETPIFRVPEAALIPTASEKDYSMMKGSMWEEKTYSNVDAYKTDSESGEEAVLVWKSSAEYTRQLKKFTLVSKVYTGIDDEDNIKKYIEGYTGTDFVKYALSENATEEAKALSKGDMALLAVNDKDEIISVAKLLYDYDGLENKTGTLQGNWWAEIMVVSGNAVALRDGVLKLDCDGDRKTVEEVLNVENMSIVLYDGFETKVVKIDALIDIVNTDAKVFLLRKYGEPTALTIVKSE